MTLHQVKIFNPGKKNILKHEKICNIVAWILRENEQTVFWTINIVFINDQDMIDLNKQFFDKDTTTDVISFNIQDGEKPEGEIYIGFEQAERQALEYCVTLENELLRLVAHGTYHLLGYDDQMDDEKAQMTELENAALDTIFTSLED